MKTLLELLVEHLKQWPYGSSYAVCDKNILLGDAGVVGFTNGHLPPSFFNDAWVAGFLVDCSWDCFADFDLPVLPCDYETAIITREMWEKAKK